MMYRLCLRLKLRPRYQCHRHQEYHPAARTHGNNENLGAKHWGGRYSSSLATPPFQNLVQALKSTNQTCTIIESSCGGLISSSLMSVPGSSRVYFGGTVAYNTKKSGKLLCEEKLHDRLIEASSIARGNGDIDENLIETGLSKPTQQYIQSKLAWTREAALSYCAQMDTDFAIAEGGATGPTFNPDGMKSGFAVLSVAGRKKKGGDIEILAQKVYHSSHGKREANMRLFADESARLCLDAMGIADPSAGEAKEVQNESAKSCSAEKEELFLDRSSHIRGDETIMKELYQQPDALHVILRGSDELLFASSSDLALPTLENLEDGALASMLQSCNINEEDLLERRTFLGRLGASQTPVFGLFLPTDAAVDVYQNSYFGNTRPRAPMLNPIHNELALSATAYMNWQATHRYCYETGSPLEYIHGGTCAKGMGSDGKPHFHWPRQDPSIIVLVSNPDSTHALLARSPRHPSYLYTALAGFVEAGETFESAVVREVHEEVGVTVDRETIGYIASQPWPFPRSCMIGMSARTHDGLSSINIDPKEISDAGWFDKEEVYQAARDSDEMGAVLERQVVEERQANGEWSGKLLVPSKGVLARTLIDNWLESN